MARKANIATRLAMTALLAIPACSYAQEEQGKPTPTHEQQPSEQGKSGATYEFRTTSRLVILDLVATDAAGHTVADLRPEEVRILENGKEQTKRDFSFL